MYVYWIFNLFIWIYTSKFAWRRLLDTEFVLLIPDQTIWTWRVSRFVCVHVCMCTHTHTEREGEREKLNLFGHSIIPKRAWRSPPGPPHQGPVSLISQLSARRKQQRCAIREIHDLHINKQGNGTHRGEGRLWPANKCLYLLKLNNQPTKQISTLSKQRQAITSGISSTGNMQRSWKNWTVGRRESAQDSSQAFLWYIPNEWKDNGEEKGDSRAMGKGRKVKYAFKLSLQAIDDGGDLNLKAMHKDAVKNLDGKVPSKSRRL